MILDDSQMHLDGTRITKSPKEGGKLTTQLELGILPLTMEIKEGLKVCFWVYIKRSGFSRKQKELHIGQVVSYNSSSVVVSGLTLPGQYNRPYNELFEIHKDTSLGMFQGVEL